MRARLLAALLAATGLSGCAENDASVQMFGLCSYPDDCTFSSSCDTQLLGDLWVDLAVTNQLQIFVELRNQLPDNRDESSGRANTNDARLEAIEITYEGQSIAIPTASIPVEDVVPADGSAVVLMYAVAPPGTGPSTGLSPSATLLRDAALAAGGPIRVVANIVAKGHYVGGGYFETGEWSIPIQVCSGCLSVADYCPAGEALVSVCPQVGQSGAAVCEAP